ncbi:Glucose-6-phosphate 1-dehydrogenase [Hartmannibacter diazotrophicus]|uniref:Glucose-6-phosphate 1-dehydrogenase n=1 Tax=Hartmannibacter diazotrophicus TaxID=1482074 RepID=A0A2C9D7J2_9HYPH|nr:glucose-6-phosphate dehydrogenase [Hartmannibacter diazotrophicus]SON56277.1 Glucose-6-phosphate 1-dehydrogenase [Hartmannibacter diazotrophicus]
MTSRIIVVDPFDYVVFGGTGDLARRKLLPALYHRDLDGQIPDEARIIGVSRKPQSDKAYRELVKEALEAHLKPEEMDKKVLQRFLARCFFVGCDATSEAGWPDLAATLEAGKDRIRAFYLATSPDLFGPICDNIGKHNLITEQTRVVVEKPLGKDLASAKATNDEVGRIFKEEQIYRIDHYLGKETVQNLMALRFANALFEPLWDNAYIDHVQITVAESLGVEGRGDYYDTSGALRDMVQNHILQLLCLVAMEAPSSMDADAVRDEKLKVLKSLKPITDGDVNTVTVRGQYKSGVNEQGVVPGYLDEVSNKSSKTETFVAIKAEVGNWRWAGVPFYLRTGKRLATRVSEIVVAFKEIPHSIFGEAVPANELVIRLQPDEGVKLWLMIKDPGPGGLRLKRVALDMTFANAFKVRNPDAYERLLLDVVRGNATLFMRRDEVEQAWTWIDPILQAWKESDKAPKPYMSGSWGPDEARDLIRADVPTREWHEKSLTME